MRTMVVLVVDDESSIVALLTEVLEGEGYRVVCACDGRGAFKIATETPPDVVLTDINMPHINGIQLSGMLRGDRRTSHLPIILMSAASPPHLREPGAFPFIGKPFDFLRLVQLVAQYAPV